MITFVHGQVDSPETEEHRRRTADVVHEGRTCLLGLGGEAISEIAAEDRQERCHATHRSV